MNDVGFLREKKRGPFSGALFLLKKFNVETGKYERICGMKSTKFMLNQTIIDATTKDSGRWKEILNGAGIASVAITATGIFTGANSEHDLRKKAFLGEIDKFELEFAGGDVLRGNFMISSYERAGDYDGEEVYSFSLESSGEIQFY